MVKKVVACLPAVNFLTGFLKNVNVYKVICGFITDIKIFIYARDVSLCM